MNLFFGQVKSIAARVGVGISSIGKPGSATRKIGDMGQFLMDLSARGLAPGGIIDVGAHRGEWTKCALTVFPGVPVLMIEPQDEVQPVLEVLASSHSGVSVIKAGAGAVAGEAVQTIWDDLAGSSFLPPVDAQALASGRQRVTQIVTLDAIMEERPDFRPDIVKLDIQGFELQALLGATTLFGRTEVFILEVSLFEFMPHMPMLHDAIAFMSARGYVVYDIPGFLRRPRDGALAQVDLAFVKIDGKFRKTNDWA